MLLELNRLLWSLMVTSRLECSKEKMASTDWFESVRLIAKLAGTPHLSLFTFTHSWMIPLRLK